MTPFQKHKLKWQSCERCNLCQTRDKVCLVRGKLPADVLFIGEAPGPSENTIGQPFIGPAGKLLDHIIEEALDKAGHDPSDTDTGGVNAGGDDITWVPAILRIAFTNLVGCIPKSEETGEKFTEPPAYAIKKCRERLEEMIDLAKPKLLVLVGQLAVKHVPDYWEGPKAAIIHPAAILRADISQRSLAIKRCVVTLTEAFAKL